MSSDANNQPWNHDGANWAPVGQHSGDGDGEEQDPTTPTAATHASRALPASSAPADSYISRPLPPIPRQTQTSSGGPSTTSGMGVHAFASDFAGRLTRGATATQGPASTTSSTHAAPVTSHWSPETNTDSFASFPSNRMSNATTFSGDSHAPTNYSGATAGGDTWAVRGDASDSGRSAHGGSNASQDGSTGGAGAGAGARGGGRA